jgi:hypothetical protein
MSLAQLDYSKKQTKFAWAKYYEAERKALTQSIVHYHHYHKVMVAVPELPTFVAN